MVKAFYYQQTGQQRDSKIKGKTLFEQLYTFIYSVYINVKKIYMYVNDKDHLKSAERWRFRGLFQRNL